MSEATRMEQKLAESDRLGIIGLRNDLLSGGAFPPTVEHVIELLTSRTLTIYFFADECRKRETAATVATQRAEAAEAQRHVWEQLARMGVRERRALRVECEALRQRAEAAEAERDALRKDAARLDFLANEPVFDGFADSPLDVYELESIVAEQNGRVDPNVSDRREAFRRVIDAALAVQPTTGGRDE